MFLFWLIIFLLTIIALAFILKPLFFYKSLIEKFISENLTIQRPYLVTSILALLIPIFGITLYLHWGSSEEVAQWLVSKKNANQVKKQIAKFGSRQNIILALHQKLQQLPADVNSAKGWYLLGKLYFNEKNMTEAIKSFQKAISLKPDQPEYILDYVSSRFYVNHQLTNEDEEMINKLLRLSPGNINAVNLLALNAYQQNNFLQAIHYWESLLKYFPPESEDSKNLLEMIRQAQNQIPQAKPSNPAMKIQILIDISKALKNKMGANDILFVYALEEGNSKIPLAVTRLKPDHFPHELTLDSHQSMIPGHSLDSADQIFIQARISKSGNAMPTKGDLIGSSKIFHLTSNKNKIIITIDQIVF